MLHNASIRVLLALLVALPPGTFRALDTLTRSLGRPAMVCAGDVLVTPANAPRSSPRPPQPLRFRTWADVTFITKAAPELTSVAPDVPDLTAQLIVSDEHREDFPPGASVISPRDYYGTPRRALIAACALLI